MSIKMIHLLVIKDNRVESTLTGAIGIACQPYFIILILHMNVVINIYHHNNKEVLYMKTSQINSFIIKVKLFKDLNNKETKLIAENIEIIKLKPNDLLFEENSPRKNLHIIYKGEIELFKKTPFGEEKRLTFFREYDFLGEGALMDDYPHSTSARATMNTTVLAVSRDRFSSLSSTNPVLMARILSNVARVISRRFRQTSSRVVNAAAQYVSGRTRTEHDLLGEREVPYEFFYGIQTLRGFENFNISGITLMHYPVLIISLAK